MTFFEGVIPAIIPTFKAKKPTLRSRLLNSFKAV